MEGGKGRRSSGLGVMIPKVWGGVISRGYTHAKNKNVMLIFIGPITTLKKLKSVAHR